MSCLQQQEENSGDTVSIANKLELTNRCGKAPALQNPGECRLSGVLFLLSYRLLSVESTLGLSVEFTLGFDQSICTGIY